MNLVFRGEMALQAEHLCLAPSCSIQSQVTSADNSFGETPVIGTCFCHSQMEISLCKAMSGWQSIQRNFDKSREKDWKFRENFCLATPCRPMATCYTNSRTPMILNETGSQK